MDVEIERLPSGEFQWVRHRQSRESNSTEARGTISHNKNHQARARRTPLTIAEIEHLIQIYAATGEGRGAFLAAIASEEREYRPRELHRSQRRFDSSRRYHTGGFSSSSDDNYPGDQGVPQGPPKGPAPYGPAPERIPVTRHRPLYRDGIYEDPRIPEREIHSTEPNIQHVTVEQPMASGGLPSRHGSVDDIHDGPRHYAVPQMHRSPYVEESLDSEDRPRRRARTYGGEHYRVQHAVSPRHDQINLNMQLPHYTVNIPGQGSINSSVEQRGGGGSDYELSIVSSTEDSQYSGHLRGGAVPLRRLPTRASAFGAGLNADDTDTTPTSRLIE
jgi:hypothetical protein